MTESEKLEMAHRAAFHLTLARTWRTEDCDPLPRPIILGEARHDSPPTSIWWKIIGAAALLAMGGTLAVGGPVMSWAAIANLPPEFAGPLAGFGIGLALGALRGTVPAVKSLLIL